MTMTVVVPEQSNVDQDREAAASGGMTIGAVCSALQEEFPDISISKIRYLENQKLISPRRTAGGYRIYSELDLARLHAVLRLQRDEFLPLRVIRQELAISPPQVGTETATGSSRATGRRKLGEADSEPARSEQQVVEELGVSQPLLKELVEYKIVAVTVKNGERFYDSTACQVVQAVGELARYGISGRHLRVFRTSADREAALLEQLVAAGLRSRDPERRKEAKETLETLMSTVSQLKHLLLLQDLQKLAS